MKMRLHTSLTYPQILAALNAAKQDGRIAEDVMLTCTHHRSSTHQRAFEIQLGAYDKHSLPAGTVDQHGRKMSVRRYKNGGNIGATSDTGFGHGDESVWAATYDEWGWFIAEIFAADPEALWGSPKNPQYENADDFNRLTCRKFRAGTMPRVTSAHP
jgi:hypothetical protein